MLVNTDELVPAADPFTVQAYVGMVPPFVGVAVNVAPEPAQIDVVDAVILTDGVTLGVTVITILLLFAVVGDAHAAFDVIVKDTVAPFVNVVVLNTDEFVPAAAPFTFHAYVGVVPPFVGVAVNVAPEPAQIVPAEDVMLTDGVTLGVTLIVTALDIAPVVVKQFAFEVN